MKLSLGVGFFSFVLFVFWSIIFALVPAEGTYKCEATTCKMMKTLLSKKQLSFSVSQGIKIFQVKQLFPSLLQIQSCHRNFGICINLVPFQLQ